MLPGISTMESNASSPRRAGVYQLSGEFLMHPVFTTTAGVGLALPPVTRFPSDADPAVLGRGLRAVLDHADPHLSHPNPAEWQELSRRFLAAARLRSWRALEAGALYCHVRSDATGFCIAATRYGGTRGAQKGFQEFGAPEVNVPRAATDAELGAGLLLALTRCERATTG
jgi:hypothetical protein